MQKYFYKFIAPTPTDDVNGTIRERGEDNWTYSFTSNVENFVISNLIAANVVVSGEIKNGAPLKDEL